MAGSTIRDNAVAWKYAALWLPCITSEGQVAGAGLGTGGTTMVVSPGYVAVLPMETSDEISWMLDPSRLQDFDLSEDILCQLVFSTTPAVADAGIDFIAAIKGFAAGALPTIANSSADGTIAFPAQTASATADALQVTEVRGFALTPSVLASDLMILLNVELNDSGAASADEVELWGVRLYGTRQSCTSDDTRQLT